MRIDFPKVDSAAGANALNETLYGSVSALTRSSALPYALMINFVDLMLSGAVAIKIL